MSEEKTIECNVLYTIRRRGKALRPQDGKTVSLPEREAKNLKALGAVSFVEAAQPAPVPVQTNNHPESSTLNPVPASDDKSGAAGAAGNDAATDEAAAAEEKKQERMYQIARAISLLDHKQKSNWTKQGQPELKPLRKIMRDMTITDAERDAAWAFFQEEQTKARVDAEAEAAADAEQKGNSTQDDKTGG